MARRNARREKAFLLKVCETRCDQCLFSRNRIVSKERMADIVKTCRKKDQYFSCHKHTIAKDDVMCRGFYETQPQPTVLQLAERLNLVKFVSPNPEGSKQ